MNKKLLSFFTLFMILFGTFSVLAENTVVVSDSYIRETIPGTVITSAYMTLDNSQLKEVVLTGVTSSISERIEIHEHTLDNGMMKMRQRDNITIPAQSTVNLKPGGLHLMIFDFKKPLIKDQVIPITLHFLSGKHIDITMTVKTLKQTNAKPMNHHHH